MTLGKKLYAADEKEFKRLLEISSEGIWDEGQNRWQGNTNTVFRALGRTSSFGLHSNSSNYWGIYYGTTAITGSGLTGAWKLIKFSYASGKLNLSVAGNSTKTLSMTIAREPRRLFFGAFPGYVDDFELIDNGVLKSKLDFE